MLKDNEHCMEFSNKEIVEYLIKPLIPNPKIKIRILSNDKEMSLDDAVNQNFPIEYVCFDGLLENFHISFYAHQTSIFITDETAKPSRSYTFNEEFMFIDDISKKKYTSSDTFHNVVYEGSLRTKTHKEILELFCEFILLLVGATSIRVEETQVSQEGWQYPKCKYVVKIKNDLPTKIEKQIENIQFQIN